MDSRQELLLKFMLALASGTEIVDWLENKEFTKDLANCASDLVDEYYRRIG